ncbi:MAG: hypothetical protein Q8L82_09565 [Nitrosomonas sp.]|nr:hypothetical protein [Nitrosomonas sp.]
MTRWVSTLRRGGLRDFYGAWRRCSSLEWIVVHAAKLRPFGFAQGSALHPKRDKQVFHCAVSARKNRTRYSVQLRFPG